MDVLVLVARVLFVFVFFGSAFFAHLGPGRTMTTEWATSQKLPAAAFLVPFSGLWITVGSLSVLLGVYGDVGALMLATFIIPTAVLMHSFWKVENEQAKVEEQVQFSKDLSLGGGALAFFVLFAALGERLGLTLTSSLTQL